MRKTFTLLFIFLITLQVAVKAQDRIYWGIPSNNISSAKLDGTDVKVSVALSGQTYDMETDFYKGILYWGDRSSVKKANTDGTNLQALYTGSKLIGGLALDLIHNKLYFSEFGGGSNVIIRRCNLDGTGMEVIVTSPISNGQTYNLTISTTLQKLYWTEQSASNSVMRCNLDGTNVETLMTVSNFMPGLTIDEKNQRLYLAYWQDNKVMTTDMTCSTTPTLVFDSSNGTFQMAVSNVENKLYFGEMNTKKIRKCNLDGSSPQDIVSGLSGQPMALSIPTIPPAPTISANETYTFELNDFLFSSVDKDLLTKIKITTLTSKGTLYLDANSNNIVDAGEAVVLNQEIAKADLVAGTLKFNPVANDYGSPYTTFTFRWFNGTSYSTLDYLQYIYVLSIAPTVTTQAVSAIGLTTATGNGNVTNLGVPFPTSYGICWNTAGSPTTSNTKVDLGATSATGVFTAAITGLTANTTYKVRAYATNEAGTSYGTEVSFTTAPPPAITGISPTSGSTEGGTTVTITGTNFTGATAVKFGSTNATSFTVNAAPQITAISPAGSAGAVDVTVTTAGGTSATSASDQFTYVIPEAQWGLAGTDGAAPSSWVSSGTLADAMSYANGLSSGTAYIQLLSDVAT
ncbi:MAG: IPT/TIG domain-containing protein, partial [Bacteroidota bacterium]|nr:IPT/TIG domain-containing protein [Bacteroidota bacterium]